MIDIRENGAKLSVSAYQEDSAVTVSLTMKRKKRSKDGTVFIYRHSDLEKALRIAHYHFTELSNFGNIQEDDKDETNW